MNLENYKIGRTPPEKGIHSYLHEIVWDACKYVGEPRKFGYWLGRAKSMGLTEFKTKLDYIKEHGIRSPKYLAVCTRQVKLN